MGDSIRPEFQFHQLNVTGIAACNAIREHFSALLTQVEQLLPAGRARALVVTKLQEACRWAVSGVAELPANQVGA